MPSNLGWSSGTATAVDVFWKMEGASCWVPEGSRCPVKLHPLSLTEMSCPHRSTRKSFAYPLPRSCLLNPKVALLVTLVELVQWQSTSLVC